MILNKHHYVHMKYNRTSTRSLNIICVSYIELNVLDFYILQKGISKNIFVINNYEK